MKSIMSKYTVLFGLVQVYLVCCLAQDVRQDPKSDTNAKLQGAKSSGINETCGTVNDLAMKVELCAAPLMDLLEGRIKRWPRIEKDAIDLCESFAGSEKCIRDVGRRCAKGLQRTIISTLASSVQRARKRECTKPRYPGILKTTQCIEKHQGLVQQLIGNATSRLNVIENQMNDPDQRTNALCCMVSDIENEIKVLLNPKCATEAATIVRLYRAVLEDVIELICLGPKCNDIFRGYKIPKPKKNDGIVSILLRIVFTLGD